MQTKVDQFTRKYFFMSAFILIAFLKLAYSPLITPDVSIWLASGLKILATKQYDLIDTFSFQKTTPLLYPSHLSSIYYALLFKLGGLVAIFIANRLLGLLFILFVYNKYLSKIQKNITNLMLSSLIIVGAFYILDRPAFLVFIPLIICVEYILNAEDKNSFKDLLQFFLWVVLWTNLHPSSLILIPFIGFNLLAKRNLIYLKYLLVCFVGVMLNPITYKVFLYAFLTSKLTSSRGNLEWVSILHYRDPYLLVLFLILSLYLIVKIYSCNRKRKILLSGFILLWILPLVSARHEIVFCVALIPFFSTFNLWNSGETINSKQRINSLFLVILLTLNGILLFENYKSNHFNDEYIQMDLVHFLENYPNLKIYNDGDGGFLALYLSKYNSKIFIDSRFIIFNDETYYDYYCFKRGELCKKFLEKYPINTVVVSKNNLKLKNAIDQRLQDWHLVFNGSGSWVYFKSNKG